jgi:hypothetical protein
MFRRNISSPSSGSKNKPSKNLAEASDNLSKLCTKNQADIDESMLEGSFREPVEEWAVSAKGISELRNIEKSSACLKNSSFQASTSLYQVELLTHISLSLLPISAHYFYCLHFRHEDGGNVFY